MDRIPVDQAANQLREACKATGARWITWLDHDQAGWHFSSENGLTQARQRLLSQFISAPKTASWLAGALSSGRTRSHATGSKAAGLGCQRIYAFPCPFTHRILVAGSDGLDTYAEGLLRILAMQPQTDPSPDAPAVVGEVDVPLWPLEPGLETSYDPQRTLESILEYLSRRISCSHGILTIRSGESFHLQAVWDNQAAHNIPVPDGIELPIQEDEFLSRMVSTHHGLIIQDVQVTSQRLKSILASYAACWMIVPILIGQRVIGMVGFAANQTESYGPAELQQITLHINRLAYSVENAIIVNEVSRYLQQLALLNELASTASLGIDTTNANPQDEFARRVMIRLRRVFKTDWAAVLLLSVDAQTLHEYGGGSLTSPPWTVPLENSVMGAAVRSGQPVRIGDLLTVQQKFILDPDFRSELAVPLKFRGRVIGALVLVSKETNAFTHSDEQLLVVIASQMAGLFENMRLNEETRERAQKLADSVRQLQAVRDTSLDIAGDLDLDTLLARVAQRARDLVGARGAELGLYNSHEQIIDIVISDTPWDNIQGIKIPLMAGVAGRMAAFGEPIIVSDYNSWQGRLFPERQVNFRAVAGVPLKFKGEVIGTLTVLDDRHDKLFTNEDVHLLELLAPQAAISIRNARLYQELAERIKAQQLAESRLIRSARLAAVGEMAAGVAHELNNPLTTVTGFVELVLEDLPVDSQPRADLQLVLEEAHRARGVVRRLLDFSRPVEDQRVRTDLSELVTQVIPLVSHLARTSGVAIVSELSEGLPWVHLDPNQIKQVLLNLIHNGLQSMPSGGTLTIATLMETREVGGKMTDCLVFQVRDTGDGIPPENLERIFEPFFSTRPSGKGTGLGLSVSYGIITSHGGWIEVDSVPAQGSCFTVFLPINTFETVS
ncbi:MAG: GAF domain-containing protein [Anaerolineales bacterium]|nr:GAF domain-containing protein [Anaerolineales bacterium]